MKHKINWMSVILALVLLFFISGCILGHLFLIDYLLGNFWHIIFVIFINIALAVFNIFILSIILKLFRQVDKKQKVFDAFKKKDNVSVNDMLLSALNTLPYELNIKEVINGMDIKIEGVKDIISIRTVEGSGLLIGKRNNTMWQLNDRKIPNPFPHIGICYLVKNGNMSYRLEDIFVGTIPEILFKIENKLINQKELYKKSKYIV